MIRLHLGLRERWKEAVARRRLAARAGGPRIMDLAEGIRLNLGCGEHWMDGWVNVDLRSEVADVVASVDHLPFPDGCVSEILAEDILEHVPEFSTAGLLAEWRRLLTADGYLRLKVPNLAHLARSILEQADRPDPYVRNIYGGHRWGPDGAWDSHHWGWTPASIHRDLVHAGFDVVSNDEAENMTVVSRPSVR